MFEQMEMAEQIYEGQTTSKKIRKLYANRDIHVSKINPPHLPTPRRSALASAIQICSLSE